MHQIHATETSADDEYISFQVVSIDVGVAAFVGLSQIYVLAERHIDAMCDVMWRKNKTN